MALNLTNLTPASIKAKNVATEEYVDSAVVAVDVSEDIADNNELFAQKLGYAAGTYSIGTFATAYDHMVAAAAAAHTVIIGGYINTELISANAINANQINTNGLIAENISATDFYGKNFYGGYFEGARIQGAVIKASYLDLDGELEVLTNYHIPVSTYNANPSLYTDAVYIEADNEYRIPSMSNVRESFKSVSLGSSGSMVGDIYAYNVANAGNNIKAVKINPSVIVSSNVYILDYRFKAQPTLNTTVLTASGTTSYTFKIAGESFNISWNLGTISGSSYKDDGGAYDEYTKSGEIIIDNVTAFNDVTYHASTLTTSVGNASYSKTVNGIPIVFTLNVDSYYFTLNAYIPSGTYSIPSFSSDVLFYIKANSLASGVSSNIANTASMSIAVAINNMI